MQATINTLDNDFAEQQMLVGTADAKAEVWHIDPLTKICELDGHTGAVSAVFLGEGDKIATGCLGGLLKFWKQQNKGYVLESESDMKDPIMSLATRKIDDRIEIFAGLASGSVLKLIYGKDTKDDLHKHRYGVCNVGCNHDYVVSTGDDNAIIVSGKHDVKIDAETRILDLAVSPLYCGLFCFAVLLDNSLIKIYSFDKNGKYKVNTIECSNASSLRWSKAGFVLAVAMSDGEFVAYGVGKDGEYEKVGVDREDDVM